MDDAELVRRALTCPYGTKQTDALIVELAYRIEALIAERDAARDAALEEAAKVAESEGVHPQLNVWNGGPEWFKHGKRIAATIRALKGKSQ